MKKALSFILASFFAVCLLAACGSNSDSKTDLSIPNDFADKETGWKLFLSNTEFLDGFTENDLQFRLQKKDVSMEEYLSFAEEQVHDFSEEQKTLISENMDRIEKILADKGYQLPPLDTITFICTTMQEEGGMKAYTHGTQIYLGESFLNSYIGKEEYDPYLLYVLSHEVFHCLTRCNPGFRADMYQLIHFTVQDKEYELPPSVLERYISNPDVEHHNAYATFIIDGEPIDCFLAFITKEHFEKQGDRFMDTGTAVLIPVDGTDLYYYPEDASNFLEVLGKNTDYTIDPEECMATNFGNLIAYDKEGPKREGYPTPEIIEGIRDYLQQYER